MIEEQIERKVPSSLIPKCPFCGLDLELSIRKDNSFLEDDNLDNRNKKYQNFFSSIGSKKMSF